MVISKDVQFFADEEWDWTVEVEEKQQKVSLDLDELVDDVPIRGTRLLSEVYERSNIVVLQPAGCEEAKRDMKWIEAINEELSMIEKNNIWELVEKPANRKVIGVKWVFKAKLNLDGFVNKLKVYPLDVKSAFLNGVLKEEIYVEQPNRFIILGQVQKVYLLKKALYGLKQAHVNFVKSFSESTLYMKKSNTAIVIVSLYVDDLLVIGSNDIQIEMFKQEMMMMFKMTDLGLMYYFLGMEIRQKQNEIFLCQKKCVREILRRFNMEKCKSANTSVILKEKLQKNDRKEPANENVYISLVRCLIYLTSTGLDIMYTISVLSIFLHFPSKNHMVAGKRIMRYLKGTMSFGIKFSKVENFELKNSADSDWVGSLDDMRVPLVIVSPLARDVSHGVKKNTTTNLAFFYVQGVTIVTFQTRLCGTCSARSTSQPFNIRNPRTNSRYDVAFLDVLEKMFL
ncbi:Retrovirus-related Pol polyprotein from transposon TNT 1-94 [Cucumis melo var. makuwa]|uniref:Retrovirus-related Pol polyprotein from transposon TNT 1-94 n=1 Tax=Cucumis melo var. makuwa TaxID=1194695 RepID=A0A5D3B6R7_CUCMM|nr:Retrovirus-related Pol polyprotein from transposon TNT 1-94 [Cucumis melo var. makuwa]TYJ95542.1 Retrovirus-related Pol polyprotein from transposon TNT 1-94 [Cucumis melo var. makuwa]